MRRYGRIIKAHVTDYNILDVMQDHAYMKHFLVRFLIEIDKIKDKGEVWVKWYTTYKNNPELLYLDLIDELKVTLKISETSASQMSFKWDSSPMQIALSACSDWITEKTGREPEFEIFTNVNKYKKINLKNYGNKKEN